MDNIKKFEDFLDRMQGLLDSAKKQGHILVRVEDLENTFPELKESEDERIRKAIHIYLDWLDGRKDYAPKGKYTIKDMISWLKKHGEPVEINPTEFDTRLQALIGKFDSLPKEELIGSLSFWLNVVQNDGTYKHEEKQGEQKSSDEVEPKFHEGEWVVDNAGYIWKIKGILNQFYILEDVEGGESRPTTEWADDTFHLWTIQDAEDGDVLVCEDFEYTSIMLFESFSNDRMSLHCWYNSKTNSFYINTDCTLRKNVNITPATKEQRDTLMKVMVDAGYTFDFEKLELKKIVVPIFNIGDTIVEKDLDECSYGTIKDIKNGQYIFTDGSSINIDEQEEWQLKTSTNIEQKPAEWSEEDEYMLDETIQHLKQLIRIDKAKHCACDVQYYQRDIDWLKSLRPQNRWKPSEKQLEALKNAIHIKPFENPSDSLLWGLYEQLKKL